MNAIRIVRAGIATIQDAGRPGYRALGVPVSGVLDHTAHALANALVGNAPHAAVVEYRLAPLEIELGHQPCRIAVCGPVDACTSVLPDGEKITLRAHESCLLPAGARLVLAAPNFSGSGTGTGTGSGSGRSTSAGTGCGYLAVAGGVAVQQIMGSRSTTLNAGFGGLEGRALAPGDELPVGQDNHEMIAERRLKKPPRYGAQGHNMCTVRAVAGPQDDHFSSSAVMQLQNTDWTVTPATDRMGMRLVGSALEHRGSQGGGANIASDGMCPGAIQVPADGQPIILLADCQTTGGYAKIAVVIGPDLRHLAHLGPGAHVRIELVTPSEAVELARAENARLIAALDTIESFDRARRVSTAALLQANLISGVADGRHAADSTDL